MASYSFAVNDFVKVNADRGVTPGMARITHLHGSGSSQEASIIYCNGSVDRYYTAHFHKDGETMRATFDYRKSRAATIGTVRHPKRK